LGLLLLAALAQAFDKYTAQGEVELRQFEVTATFGDAPKQFTADQGLLAGALDKPHDRLPRRVGEQQDPSRRRLLSSVLPDASI